MRRARKDFAVTVGDKTYVIPKGNQVCASPTVNGRLGEEWGESEVFNPRRFLSEDAEHHVTVTHGENDAHGGKFKWVPFGAGRHRCIGFEFAQIQIRCVLSVVIRNFVLELPEGKVPDINFHTMIHTPLNPSINYKRRVPAQ
jgi:sterol 14-demethylase